MVVCRTDSRLFFALWRRLVKNQLLDTEIIDSIQIPLVSSNVLLHLVRGRALSKEPDCCINVKHASRALDLKRSDLPEWNTDVLHLFTSEALNIDKQNSFCCVDYQIPAAFEGQINIFISE